MKNIATKLLTAAWDCAATYRYHKAAKEYDIEGFKRIYFYHIRKTAGTSFNYMFLSLTGSDPKPLYSRMVARGRHRISHNGLIYAGWNKNIIQRGDYFYGFSHLPKHEIHLPKSTFTITCLRDPAERLLSHYRMLLDIRDSGRIHPETGLLGNSIDDFVSNLPRSKVSNQLYMFSKRFDINEAYDSIRSLSHLFFVDQFDQATKDISTKLGLSLSPLTLRQSKNNLDLNHDQLARLREYLEDEYRLYQSLRCD